MDLSFANKEYEISLYKIELSKDYDSIFDQFTKIDYYKQNKIAVIGSSKHKAPIDACSPKFTININGKKTLTFNMYFKYYDYNKGDYELNPLIPYIHNDSLIQLKLNDEVYDFLVTKIQKNSDNSVYQFTAEDAYIIELGKNGFNAELAEDLENNMGTVNELGENILKNCDWKVAPHSNIEAPFHSDLIIQTLEDSLYEIEVENLPFVKRTNYLPDAYYIREVTDYSIQSTITGKIFAFYNDITDFNKLEIGFLYWNGDEETAVLNADGTVVNSYNYVTTDLSLRELNKKLSLMRGRRVVRSPKTKFDYDLKKTVNFFKKDNKEYYGYAETDYMSPILVENYVSNPCNMTSLYDWGYVNRGEKLDTHPRLLAATMPYPTKSPYVSYLKIEANREVLNKGLQGHRDNMKSMASKDKYVLAFLKQTSGYENDIDSQELNFDYTIAFYHYNDPEEDYVTTYSDLEATEEGVISQGTFKYDSEKVFNISDSYDKNKIKTYAYNVVSMDPKENITDLTERLDNFLGLFIKNTSEETASIYEVMFFPYREFQEEIVWPGKIFINGEYDITSPLCQIYYNIYEDRCGESVLVDRTLNTEGYELIYNDTCEKISNISGKEKNYYTLLSDLTKTFECWMEPKLERDEKGEIIYKNYYYTEDGEIIEYSDQPLTPSQENIGKFYEEDGVLKLLEQSKVYNWIKIDTVYDKNGEVINEVTNDTDICYVKEEGNLFPIPITTISYLENFERFIGKNNLSYNEIKDYALNYLYLVNYEGVDTEAGWDHPIKEFYQLKMTSIIQARSISKEDNFYVLKKPSKWIVFRNYLNSTPNWAGFKYGINVKSIQRTEDNSKFSTKVIVKNNTNEFALNGDRVCTIARAINNPTRDNFIIDFGYYIRHGMMDKESVYKDLYENYYKKFSEYNITNEELIEEHINDSFVLDKLQSQYETYYLAYNAACENIAEYCKKVADCGEKYAITPDWDKWNIGGLCPVRETTYIINAVSDESEINSEVNSEVFAGVDFDVDADEEMIWYDLKAIYYYDGKFYTCENGNKKEFKFYEQAQYYINVGDQEILETWPLWTGEYDPKKKHGTPLTPYHVYQGLSYKLAPFYNKADYYWNSALYDYANRIDEDLIKKAVYGPLYRDAEVALKETKERMENRIKKSVEVVSKKKALLKQFNSKYADFLRESSWSKDTYRDDELYYLDARDSLHAAAFPQISYSISVVDIEEIDKYSAYKLRVGDYTFIEDTEFFGWDDKGRPAKEWVVITEATYDLEQPANNSLKIQNYKSHIEDLFSRLSASLQQLELNKGGYNREICERETTYKTDSKGIYSSNYNKELNTGWALFNDGTWFLGELSQI